MPGDSEPGLGTKILKTIGVITAVISLVLGTRQIVILIQDSTAKKHKAAELKAEALQLASSGLYSKAWEVISPAVDLDPHVREIQAEIAMQWLRNVSISPNGREKSFTEIVDKVVPVLHRVIDTTKREFSSTVKAHIGWATYLLFKEGNWQVKVDEQFASALHLDSTNTYANAMYAFWILYPGHGSGSIEDANRHFAMALKTGSDNKYVRGLMFAAFRNKQTVEYQAQIVKLASEMRRNNEVMDFSDRKRILSEAYYMYRSEIVESINKVLTPKEHLQTFLYLTDGMDVREWGYMEDALARIKKAAQ